jgi:MoxR-like ATPase
MLAFSEKLFALLVSPYPFIAVRTWESRRVIDTLRALATQLKRELTQWGPSAATPELLGALAGVGEAPHGTIAVLEDAHPYLEAPAVVRALRTLEPVLAGSQRVVVFVGPTLTVPRELIRDVVVLDAPLPGRIELETILDEVLPAEHWLELPRERLVAAALGLTLREARRAYSRARFERQQAVRRGDDAFDLEAAVVAEKRRQIEVDRVLQYGELREGLGGVGGLDGLKGWLEERRHAFSTAAAEFGLPAPRGVLLTGVQGCGKSLFAKAIASFWGVPLLRLDIARLFDGSLPPEAALARALQIAEALAPAVLWVDEIDKAFGEGSEASVQRMMGSLLFWLQDKQQPVFFAATANRVAALPPELLRKGRFDEVFFVDLPDREARVEILAIHLRRRGRDPGRYDLGALAELTAHFSGAELEQVVVAGLFKAFGQGRELSAVDLEAASRETIPLYRTYEGEIKALREWAEGRARRAATDRSLLDLFQKRGDA